MTLVEIKNLVKIYQLGETEIAAINNISLVINEGEFVAITGASGSGKSTLMHLLGCLDTPTNGTYLLDGDDVGQLDKDALAHIRNQKIGFVFQQFHLLPDLPARENVALPLLYAGVQEYEARKRATEFLNLIDLADRIQHYPYQLSGGEQQRVAIARALANTPKIILADEPTGNLDTETGSTIMDLFTELNQKENVTIILVTHEHQIAQRTKRIITLRDGELISDEKKS